jgi:uncharacterized Zn-binding protein involved in type VI secretion
MSHKAAARKGDATSCPKDQPVEHKGGKISAGSSNIMINGKPAARVGDAISDCEDGSDDAITEGSGCVTFNGKPAAFLGNATDHGGEITKGSGNVFIGASGNPIEIGDFGTIEFGDFGEIYLGGEESDSDSPEAMSAPPSAVISALSAIDTAIAPFVDAVLTPKVMAGLKFAAETTVMTALGPAGWAARGAMGVRASVVARRAGTAAKTGAKGGVSTKSNDIFKRPKGVPDNWAKTPANKGEGVKYLDPKNNRSYVRIQSGKPNSPYASQRNDYVSWMKDGRALDKNGIPLKTGKSAESHIPLKDFKFKPELFK